MLIYEDKIRYDLFQVVSATRNISLGVVYEQSAINRYSAHYIQ